jgi:soluble lytic murein transglycosylase-like protein
MTPPRSEPIKRKQSRTSRQTAQGNGCLSGFLIPPIAVVFVSALLVAFVNGFANTPTSSNNPSPTKPIPQQPIGGGEISAIFTPEIQFWSANLKRWATENGVDVNLAATVMQIESCGNPDARSSAGAMGLFQVMPFHFVRGENGYDTETNARRGMDYLRRSLERAGGNARLALAGYNGGIGVIGRAESAWPAETKRYVYWGEMYNDALQNADHSARLDEWLKIGGASLCARSRQRLGID